MNKNHDCRYMEYDCIWGTSLYRCYCSMRPNWIEYHLSDTYIECEYYEPKGKEERTC